jgi:glycosyltransferase involved in cell wall biosynthesis
MKQIESRTKKPAILILINVRWWNATAFYAINIARLLDKDGYRIFIGCCPDFPAYQAALQNNLNVVPLSFTGYNPYKLLKNLILLLQTIKKFNICIVNSHRSEDHSFSMIAKKLTGIRWVLTRGDQRKIKSSPLAGLVYKRSDAIVVTCKSITKNNPILTKAPMAPAVIYGSVDHDHFKSTQKRESLFDLFNLNKNHLHIGLVGRLSPVKDPWTYLEAIAKLPSNIPPTTFIIAGPSCEITHEDLARETERLRIAGRVVHFSKLNNIADLMALIDIGVITSVASETISRVLLEFMYLGKPVIGTKVNAIGEIIEPGQTGELFPPKTPSILAKHMETLLKKKELRLSYGRKAEILYHSSYSEASFMRLYEKVLN